MSLGPEQLTIIGMLVAIGAAGLKRLWVFGWTYAEMKANLEKQLADMTADRDGWKVLAFRGTSLAEKVTEARVQDDG